MKTLFFPFWILVLFATAAGAEVSPYVPSYSGVYHYVEKLEALGCAFPTLRSLGPQSFSDVRAALDWDEERTKCVAPEWLLDERQILIRPAQPLEFRSDGFSAIDDKITLVGVPAVLWPTFPARQNRIGFNGINLNNEAVLSGRMGGEGWGFAAAVTPGFYAGYDASNSKILGRFYLQEFYAKAGYGFAEFSTGRYARRFGDSRHGGLLFSAASAPLDTWEFALRPYVLGGGLSVLGPVSFRTWIGNQGTDFGLPDTQLWGVELALRPFHWWETAVLELNQFGGVGGPLLSGGEILQAGLLGGGDGLAERRHTSLAIYQAFWLPQRYAKVYGQVLWNRLSDSVPAPFSYQVGLWLPKLEGFEARFEYAKTAPTAYQHPIWTQGLTYRNSTLGHPLGPDAQGMYLDIGLPPIFTWWHSEVGLLYEARRLNPATGQATEQRMGAVVSTGRRWGLHDLQATVTYHSVQGAQYVPSAGLDVLGLGAVYRYTFLY